MTDGLVRHKDLGESIFIFWALGVILYFIPFFDEILLSQQNNPRCDVLHRVTSGDILFAYVPLIDHQVYQMS